ncbi:MAG: hypothetical protein AB7L66_22185, partial [Gemmatimonadales bacterium]
MRSAQVTTAAALLLAACSSGGTGPADNVHSGLVTSDQTWGSDGTPQIVRGRVRIEGAKLTIAPGATLEFDAGAVLLVSLNGRLEGLGTAAAPITMRGSQQGRGRWIGLRFRASTANVLRYANLSGCGAEDPETADSIPAGCVVLGNQFKSDEAPAITLDHVTVDEAAGGGVGLYGQSRFEGTSSVLTVRNSGYVARIPAREAGRFPLGGAFASNDTNDVRLTGGTVPDNTTLSLQVPWSTEGDILVEGPSAPTLVIPAGTVMRLDGALIAGRNAAGGIQIGSDGGAGVTLLPARERWGGVTFGPFAVGGGVSNAVLESCGIVATAICLTIQGSSVEGPAPMPILKNLTIRKAMGVGLAFLNGARPGPGSANVTITETIQRPGLFGGEGGWPIGIDHSPVSAIPVGHYTGNYDDYIWINQVEVRETETWVK